MQTLLSADSAKRVALQDSPLFLKRISNRSAYIADCFPLSYSLFSALSNRATEIDWLDWVNNVYTRVCIDPSGDMRESVDSKIVATGKLG